MPRARTGQVRFRNGKWTARVTLEGDKRPTFELATCAGEADKAKATERAALLAELADKLRGAKQLDLAEAILTKAASRDGADLGEVTKLVDRVVAGELVRSGALVGSMTYKALSQKWTRGELHRAYPDHVKKKKDRCSSGDEQTSGKHIYDLVGDVPIERFTLDDAERVMRAIPSELSKATRRHVAQLMHRVLSLAVFPLRLREANPLPKGWLPQLGERKALSYLYADEEAKLLGCTKIPLCFRVLLGFLAREGCRRDEAYRLRWRDVDLARGVLALDENKTDDPRAWALDAGVAETLSRWKAMRGDDVGESDPVFVDEHGRAIVEEHLADRFRDWLKIAGVARAQLFERSGARRPIRIHDLRATFVTHALAGGKSEAWVMDRTGHTTSAMLHKYRRAARSVAEIGQAGLVSLAAALPDLEKAPEKAQQTPRTWRNWQTRQIQVLVG